MSGKKSDGGSGETATMRAGEHASLTLNRISMAERRDSGNHLGSCSRRDVIRQLLCAGAVASVAKGALHAQAPQATGRVDLHHHFFAATPLTKKFIADVPYPAPILGYTAARSLEAMDQAGVSTAMLSCPISFGDDPAAVRQDARAFSREMNEYGATLVTDHPGRFGLFAVLPLSDTDGSLREIEYAFDTLRADGVGLVTSYGSQWLGDDGFDAVFDELNRRKAVVYSHPVDGPCCHRLLPNAGPQAVEWNTDTSRAIWNLINDGTDPASGLALVAGDMASSVPSKATRYGNITFVWSHAGGSLLGLVGRFLGRGARTESLARPPAPNSRLHHLRRFYYDTSSSTNPIQIQALKSLVGLSQIVFGSDFPFVPPMNSVDGLRNAGLSADELRAIERENPLRVLGRKA
jgi:predicted TIM-barrel fold metal-dependent hydrolase